MNYSSRFFLYAPIALLLGLAAAAGVWWDRAATSLNDRLIADNGHEIMPGVTMRYAAKSMNGFPFNLDTVLDGLVLQIQMHTGPLIWHSEHFAIHSLTYSQDQQIFEAAGTQSLDWTGSDGAHHHFGFAPGSLRASAVIRGGSLARFDLDLVALNSPDLSAQRLQFHMRKAPDRDALEFVVEGDGLRDAAAADQDGGRSAREFSVVGNIAPERPLESLLQGLEEWRAALEGWRRSSGVLTAEKVDTRKAGILTDGSGKFSLDSHHRLSGHLSARFTSDHPDSVSQFFSSLEGGLVRLY